jgi:hypothetical protein
MKPTKKMLENAHKVAFLAEQYPEHTLGQIIALLQIPSIDINAAVWTAVEAGLISEPDKSTGTFQRLKTPAVWAFGDTVRDLQNEIVYCFNKLARNETDLEENYLSQWTAGYTSHDVMICLNNLLNSNILSEYQIEDGENSYTFYTLYENREQLWGRKSFKKDPLAKRKGKKGGNSEA